MFTGLIEEIGRMQSVRKGAKEYQLVITAEKILKDMRIGDSIAVNGVCLTVTSYDETSFVVDVMPETIKATALHILSPGSPVNLERAMTPQRRFGGHFVTGHVDGTGTITRIRPEGNAIYYVIETKPELLKYMVKKGSVAVDGISLTVVEVTDKAFSVSIIPHTLTATILHTKKVGDVVNLECDMLAKYLERLLAVRLEKAENKGERPHESLTLSLLKKHGFA